MLIQARLFFNPIQDGPYRECTGMVGAKSPHLLIRNMSQNVENWHIYTLKEIQKYINYVRQPREFCWLQVCLSMCDLLNEKFLLHRDREVRCILTHFKNCILINNVWLFWLRKKCSENTQQIYSRTPMPKRYFNKVAKHRSSQHRYFSMGVLL